MDRNLVRKASFMLVLLIFIPSLTLAVPNIISYQGILNDSDGSPVNGTVNMTFNIYNTVSGGTSLWSETQNLQVSNGIFNVQLGSAQPLTSTIFQQDTLYLGIQVGADPEMAPRQRITSGAYSHKSTLVEETIVPVGSIIAWAKNLSGVPALPEGWVECNGQILDDIESPLNGSTIPNLNGENRFLRGNTTSAGTGGSNTHKHKTAEINNHHVHSGSDLGYGTYNASSSNCSVSYSSSFCSSSGTYARRYTALESSIPPFYNVIWIIKVK